MRARYMDPVTGRFVSEDPSCEGVNWFTYANGNPSMKVDSTGRGAEDLVSVLLKALIALGIGGGELAEHADILPPRAAALVKLIGCVSLIIEMAKTILEMMPLIALAGPVGVLACFFIGCAIAVIMIAVICAIGDLDTVVLGPSDSGKEQSGSEKHQASAVAPTENSDCAGGNVHACALRVVAV